MTGDNKKPLLQRVRIDCVVRDGREISSVVDLGTGRPILCTKFELTHEARERPVLVLYCTPREVEYLIDGVECAIAAAEYKPKKKRWVYIVREKDTLKVVDSGIIEADHHRIAEIMAESTCRVDTAELSKCTIEVLPETETYGRRLSDKDVSLRKDGEDAQA